MDIDQIIEESKRNAIELKFNFNNTDTLRKGCSKFGGNPDLPKNFEWPYYMTSSYRDKEIKNRPLTFFVQINCEEVVQYDTEDLLPKKGMLYFFYEMESQKWGFDANDLGCSRVFYADEVSENLHSTNFPDDLFQENRMPEASIVFEQKIDIPSSEEFVVRYEAETHEWKEYEKNREKIIGTEDISIIKLLGYANVIQNEMLTQCELISRNEYIDDPYINMAREEEIKLHKDSCEWILLFQLDTIQQDKVVMMFGDCGRIYFYIKRSDLINKKFENTWLILQCE